MTEQTKAKREVIFCVYGTLKSKYGNNTLFRTAEFLGEHVTSPVYTLYNGGFPIIERDGKTAVHCELYRTDDETVIARVFGLEGCSSQVQGHPNNWYDFDLIETPHGNAVIFVMDKDKSGRSEVLEGGVWGR